MLPACFEHIRTHSIDVCKQVLTDASLLVYIFITLIVRCFLAYPKAAHRVWADAGWPKDTRHNSRCSGVPKSCITHNSWLHLEISNFGIFWPPLRSASWSLVFFPRILKKGWFCLPPKNRPNWFGMMQVPSLSSQQALPTQQGGAISGYVFVYFGLYLYLYLSLYLCICLLSKTRSAPSLPSHSRHRISGLPLAEMIGIAIVFSGGLFSIFLGPFFSSSASLFLLSACLANPASHEGGAISGYDRDSHSSPRWYARGVKQNLTGLRLRAENTLSGNRLTIPTLEKVSTFLTDKPKVPENMPMASP